MSDYKDLVAELEQALAEPESAPPVADGDAVFNAGCDARLAGLPLSACPWPAMADKCGIQWRHGWRNAQATWGFAVRGRWNYKPLPVVEEK